MQRQILSVDAVDECSQDFPGTKAPICAWIVSKLTKLFATFVNELCTVQHCKIDIAIFADVKFSIRFLFTLTNKGVSALYVKTVHSSAQYKKAIKHCKSESDYGRDSTAAKESPACAKKNFPSRDSLTIRNGRAPKVLCRQYQFSMIDQRVFVIVKHWAAL